MKGTLIFGRLAVLGAASFALSTGASAFNTVVGGQWQQITFANSSFSPNTPATWESDFTNSGAWSTAPVVGHNEGVYLQNGGGFTNASEWVGTAEYQRGGWSIFYLDFNLTAATAISGYFSSDNTSFLMVNNFLNGSTLSTNFNFSLDGNPAGGVTNGFLGYRPAQDPNNGNQNSYATNPTSFTSDVLGVGNHRLWAVVRNDIVNQPEFNPLAFRLEFATNGGGGDMNPVPEPFTMALGAAGIGLAMRRRMKKSS